MPVRKHKQRGQEIGCGFLLSSGLAIIVLLIINGLFVRAFFSVNLSGIDERIFQAAQFVLPILMIFIEYWCFDWLVYQIKAYRQNDNE